MAVEVSSARPERPGRVVELITDLEIRHLVAESASRSPDLLGLYGVAAGVLEDVEKKTFPSKPTINHSHEPRLGRTN